MGVVSWFDECEVWQVFVRQVVHECVEVVELVDVLDSKFSGFWVVGVRFFFLVLNKQVFRVDL